MKLLQTTRFREQRDALALRFTCEHCAMFEPSNGSCANGFPTTEHRLARYESLAADLVFCKEFEMC